MPISGEDYVAPAGYPVTAHTLIEAAVYNNQISDLVTALSTMLAAIATNTSNITANAEAIESALPQGAIISWSPGYFTNASNGGYTYKLGTANTVAAANTWLANNCPNFVVCDGSNIGEVLGSAIFDDAGAYLPNLTDDRFLMGDTVAGGGATIGSNTMRDHLHTSSLTAAGQTHSGNSSSVSDPGNHAHNMVSDNTSTYGGGPYVKGNNGNLSSINTGSAGSHTHTVSISHTHSASSVSGTIGTGSVATSTENRPVFLSCFYIMKVV